MMAERFKDLLLREKVKAENIVDFIGDWHDGDSTEPLYTYLGLTEDEYKFWVENDDNALEKKIKNSWRVLHCSIYHYTLFLKMKFPIRNYI